MKIILSRKGFDSKHGGKPSPIFEDGRLLSLPLPMPPASFTFADIHPLGLELGTVVENLTKGQILRTTKAHLDPDLERTTVPRSSGWLPAFGQSGGAQTHLANQGVGIGDLFLFFGWFKRVERVGGGYRYARKAPDVHAIFGWLRIGQMLDVKHDPIPNWLEGHPHLAGVSPSPNVIYVADKPEGGGIFKDFRPDLQLTAPGYSRSHWQLPKWFFPHGGHGLSRHPDPRDWQHQGDHVLLRIVDIGQEFVLDCDYFPEAPEWVRNTIGCKA